MALAMVAAASPLIDAAKEAVAPVDLSAPAAPAAPAQVSPVAPLVPANHEHDVAAPNAHNGQRPRVVSSSPVPPSEKVDMSKMGMWVPCSESECLKDMTPEQQVAFKRDCEKMMLSRKNVPVNGQSRNANDNALTYFQMILPAKDAARLALNNHRVTAVPSLHVVNDKAVGNRPAGKNLAAAANVAAAAARAAVTVAAAK
ncbi:hypothetical protein GGI10_001805 [Coemansia sp. RSA 2530]|nr:hypothetical protein GGI10_001805 [Coemansia sp. RSA 2530]